MTTILRRAKELFTASAGPEEIPDQTAQLLGEYVEVLNKTGLDSGEEKAFAQKHSDAPEFTELVKAAREVKRFMERRSLERKACR